MQMEIERKAGTEFSCSLALYKIITCLLIMMHHTYLLGQPSNDYLFYSGLLYVEFFLMISGWFTAQGVDLQEDGLGYAPVAKIVRKMIRGVLPYVLICVHLRYLLELLTSPASPGDKAFLAAGMPFEMLFGRMNGLYFTELYNPLWYLSGVFLVLPIFHCILIKHKDFYFHILIFAAPACLYGYLLQNYGNAMCYDWVTWNGVFVSGLIRILAGLTLGAAAYSVSKVLRKKEYTPLGRSVITLLEVGAFWL